MNIMFAAFGIGGWEVVLILAVVLVLFGARKLPELAKGLGQGIKEFKKATRAVTDEIQQSMDETNYSASPPKQVEPAAKKISESSEPEKASALPQSKEHTS